MVDSWLGRFLNVLFSSPLADSTVVALVSDYGVLLEAAGWVRATSGYIRSSSVYIAEVRSRKGSFERTAPTRSTSRPRFCPWPVSEPRRRFGGVDLMPVLDGKKPARAAIHLRRVRELLLHRGRRLEAHRAKQPGAFKLYDRSTADPEESDVADSHPAVVERLWDGIVVGEIGGPPPFYTEQEFLATPAPPPA